MPKHNIDIIPRTPIEEQLKREILRFFPKATIEKLERLGGRITISVAAPYRDPKVSKKGLVVDAAFVEEIRKHRSNLKHVENTLNGLTKGQLITLGQLLGEPIKPSLTLPEIRNQLCRSLQAQDVWDRISGGTSNSAGA